MTGPLTTSARVRAFIKLGDRVAVARSNRFAEVCYRKATELLPEYAPAWYKLGACQGKQGRIEEQLASYRLALQFSPDDPEAVYWLGDLLSIRHRLDELDELLNAYRGKFSDNPWIPALEAISHWCHGRPEDAKAGLEESLRLQPTQRLEGKIWWLLGTILDQQGSFREAYRCFERMNAVASVDGITDDNAFMRRVGRLDANVDQNLGRLESRPPLGSHDDKPPPIFLVGFPRSGNTLMGAILNSHPDLTTRDEWGGIGKVITWLQAQGLDYPDELGAVPDSVLPEIREVYREHMRLEPGIRYVDKLPLQSIYLGLIWSLFPGAPTMVMIRNPYDVCLSCFAQRFSLNPAMENFLTLERAAIVYDRVMSLVVRYLERPLAPVKCVYYEQLTADMEGECRSICEFLRIPWNPEMLEFQRHARNAADVRTPSYYQIVQPVYRHSVERWRNYEEFMGPLAPYLDPWCRYFGYSSEWLPGRVPDAPQHDRSVATSLPSEQTLRGPSVKSRRSHRR